MAAAFIVNGQTFITKHALAAHTQAILQSYRPGEVLSVEDTAFVADLLLRHPRADEKIGDGIARIRVARIKFNATGFVLDRIDGTTIDFSYRQCIRPLTHASRARQAFRRAVEDQVLAVKAAAIPAHGATIVCPVTGEVVGWEQAHVDHAPPATFAALLARYLGERDATLDDVPLVPSPDGIGWLLAEDCAADWAQWHQRHARLRVVSRHANLVVIPAMVRGAQ